MISTKTERQEGAVARVRDSWGGLAIVLLAWSVIATAILSRLLDSTTQHTGFDGRRYLESSGTTGRLLGAGVLALAVIAATIAIVQKLLVAAKNPTPIRRSPYALLLLALVLWWSLCVVIRGEVYDFQTVFEVVAAIIIVTGVVASPPTTKTLASLIHLMNIFAVASLAYAYALPEQQLMCRVDKCGIFGNLFSGFLFQENGAARFVLLLMPAAAIIKSRVYLALTICIAGTYIAATGSRTSLAGLAIAILVVVVIRRRLMGKTAATSIPWVLRLAPLAALGVSFYLLYEADSSALTGRGEIYAGIRDQLHGQGLIFGSGAGTVASLSLAFNALAFGEHGEVPHLMVRAGIVGVLLFAGAMFAVLRKKAWTPLEGAGFAFLFVAATQFATEPALELELRTMSFSIIVLTIGLLARNVQPEVSAECSPQRHQKTPKLLLPDWHKPDMRISVSRGPVDQDS